MTLANVAQVHPFGEPDCETEVALLKEDYPQYYFHQTHFSDAALERSVYLIIGRRGCGKTALTRYFSFQKKLRGAVAIDVDEPEVFQAVIDRLSSLVAQSREVAIPRIVKIWELIIWSIIFRELQDQDVRIKAACIFGDQEGKVSHFVRHLLKTLAAKFLGAGENLAEEFEALIDDYRVVAGKAAVLELAKQRPIIVAFDTLENYQLSDDAMMRATAGLIECASTFTRTYAHQNIHLKVFLMAEIFPHLKEEVILNTLKVVRDEIYLHWRPKTLLRLICWRFYRYLKSNNYPVPVKGSINWDDSRDVREKMWEPYFGRELVNGRGLVERTFPYVLRHTQLRPRQLIVLCNKIARLAQRSGHFPYFNNDDIVEGIREAENALADEVYNSYCEVYPNVGQITEALYGMPVIFKGNELDKRARQTAAAWPSGQYSPLSFRRLVSELGIVGRVRKIDESAGFLEADFEYVMDGRLPLLVDHECVIHPMFFNKLNIAVDRQLRIYPFPSHPAFRDLDYS